MKVFSNSQILNSSNPQFLNSSVPQILSSLVFTECLKIVDNFFEKNRKKWWKVGKNALILQVEKMIRE